MNILFFHKKIFQEKLGEGSFAVVKRATWTQAGSGRKVAVAVKLLRDSSAQFAEELQLEINNMHKLRFTYLIRLYGITFSQPIMMVCLNFEASFIKFLK